MPLADKPNTVREKFGRIDLAPSPRLVHITQVMSRKRLFKQAVKPELSAWPATVMGGKYVRMLERHVRKLRDGQHGNRRLFLDDSFIVLLLAFFNATIRSLRTIEDFSQTRQAQRFLSVAKVSRSTMSDFNRLVDPALLEPLIARLLAEVRQRCGSQDLPDLPAQLQTVLAVDGSFFRVASDVAWAFRRRTDSGRPAKAGVRLDVHLEAATWLPTVVDVSGRDTSEAEHAAAHLTPGAIHVYDRGIFSFELLAKQQACGAFFVHRLREPNPRSPHFIASESRPLTDEDRAAGVTSDGIGRLAGSTHRAPPDFALREIVIAAPDEPQRTVRLLTNLWDQPAWVIALIYRYRWQVELFFRWLKVSANFQHLISESRAGILLSFYVAMIGVLLQCAHTGTHLNKYAYNLLSMVAAGQTELDDILPIVAERNRQIELDKASLARRRATKHA